MKETHPSDFRTAALVPFGFCMAPFLHFHSAARCPACQFVDGCDVEVWHLDRKIGRLEREKKVKQSFAVERP